MAARKTPRKPLAGETAVEPEHRVLQGWTPLRLDLARTYSDLGDLTYAADLCHRVMGDDRVIGPLQALCGIADLPVVFKSVDDTESDPIVEAFEADFWEVMDDDLVSEAIRWMSLLGVALLHVTEWRENEFGRVVPVLEVWNPRNLKWDAKLRTWQARVNDAAQLRDITPGDGEWILLTPYGRKHPWSKAPWYALGVLWLAAQYAKINWQDWNDNHAKPFRVAEQKENTSGAVPDEPAAAALAKKIASLVRGGSMVMPEGMTLKLLDSIGKGWESFRTVLADVWPAAASIALTGNNLATEVKGGSYAAAGVHYRVSYDRIRTLAATLSTTLRKQLWFWWTEFNFGDGRRTPFADYDCKPPPDPDAEASRFSTASQALKSLLDGGVPPEAIDLQQLRERYQLPIADELEQLPPKPPAPAAPAVPAAAVARAQARGAQRPSAAAETLPAGAQAGQDYADAVAEAMAEELRAHLAPHMRDLIRIVEEAESAEEAQAQIAAHYRDQMNAKALAKLFSASLQMAGIGGSAAVSKDA